MLKKAKKTNMTKKKIRKPVKEIEVPKLEVDEEYIHNLIKAEVAVQVEKSKEYKIKNPSYNGGTWYPVSKEVVDIIHISDSAVREEYMGEIKKYRKQMKVSAILLMTIAILNTIVIYLTR